MKHFRSFGCRSARLAALLLLGVVAALRNTAADPLAAFPAALKANGAQRIDHVIVIYPENRSFDSLYGKVPGANGILQALATRNATQLSPSGEALPALPAPNTSGERGATVAEITPVGPDSRFPATVKNEPYDLAPFVPLNQPAGNLTHKFYSEQYQINSPASRFAADPRNAGGPPMSKFAAWTNNPGLVMGFYDVTSVATMTEGDFYVVTVDGDSYFTENQPTPTAKRSGQNGTPEWRNWDSQYVIGDNTFHSAFGGSFLNHQFLISARAPVWPVKPDTGLPPDNPDNPGLCTFTDDTHYFPTAAANPLAPSTLLNGDRANTNDPTLPGFPKTNAHQRLGPGDYWSINTTQPVKGPACYYRTSATGPGAPAVQLPEGSLLPTQDHATIGDRLSAAGISWAWFSEGWNMAKHGNGDFLFAPHHSPFAFYAKYALAMAPQIARDDHPRVPGTDSPGSAAHCKDFYADFFPVLALPNADKLIPAVSFIKPIGENNVHPGNASVQDGLDWTDCVLRAIKASPIWPHTVVFIIYDENGGLWDHVPPPVIDAWGPGTRIPFIVISPFAKGQANGTCTKPYVDHTQYETVSLLSFLEGLFDLAPLSTRDAAALAPVAPFMGQPDLIIKAWAGKKLAYQLPGYKNNADNTAAILPASYKAKAGSLPPGLSLDPETGVLSGAATQIGSFPSELSVAFADESEQTCTMRIDVVSGDR